MWLSLNQKLNLAPLKHVNRALDAGCGTGIWAIDFGMVMFSVRIARTNSDYIADAHPETEVLGVDLAPVQPHK